MNALLAHCPIPDLTSINTGLSAARESTMLELLGVPSDVKGTDCHPPRASLERHMIRADVGPFFAYGLLPAVESLQRVFKGVRNHLPDLYALLGTAGMTCCRLVRGSLGHWSNHSWGTALDLKIDGELVPLGANYVFQGLLDIRPYFQAEGWFWAAGYHGRPDPMHFEASDELIRKWHASGVIG